MFVDDVDIDAFSLRMRSNLVTNCFKKEKKISSFATKASAAIDKRTPGLKNQHNSQNVKNISHTLFAVSFDKARLCRFGVVYVSCVTKELKSSPLDCLLGKGSFLFLLRASLTCSGVGDA